MDRATRAAKDGIRTNGDGERVVGGTRRADGSIRKERKIREGYVPPDEQKTYMSRGKKWKAEVDAVKCPGLDVDETAGMSKAAKKNAARRAKKATEGAVGPAVETKAAEGTHGGPTTAGIHAATQGMASVRVDETGEGEEGFMYDMLAVQKRIRALKKKVRLCEEQVAKVAEKGETQTEELQRKVDTIPEWLAEIEKLEAGGTL